MIIYLHGFNSTGESAKGRFLKQHLPDIEVLTPTYHYAPGRAVRQLEKIIRTTCSQDKVLLVGSSLGGYYAQYLSRKFRIPAVLINPALQPIVTLDDYLGENTNYYSGETYTVTREHLDKLATLDVNEPCSAVGSKPVPTLLLLDKADEVIYYSIAEERYKNCARVIVYEGGDHQFQHMQEALPEIISFYKQ